MIRDKILTVVIHQFGLISENVLNRSFTSLKMGDFDEWDSLGNLNLLLAIEEEFSVRFTSYELSTVQSLEAIEEILVRTWKLPENS